MVITDESVIQVYCELDDMLHMHHAKTLVEDGLPRLCMNWQAYAQLNNCGDVALFTARSDAGALLGYVMYHIHEHMQHRGIINAACVGLVTRPDMFGKGIATALVEHAEPILKERGVDFITHMYRTRYDTKPLFPKLGYELVEQAYLKDIR